MPPVWSAALHGKSNRHSQRQPLIPEKAYVAEGAVLRQKLPGEKTWLPAQLLIKRI